MPGELKEVKSEQEEGTRCHCDECPELEKIIKISRLLTRSPDRNSKRKLIIKLKKILNPEETEFPEARQYVKEEDGTGKTDKDNDDLLQNKDIASGAQEQKLIFDGYSDSELERLWSRDYNEKAELKFVDFKKLEYVRQQQIELLGSEQMYKRVNDNLKNLRFEAHFAQEQSKLFRWRVDFFWKHFPLREYDGENESCWSCNLNITLLWPRVATFAFAQPQKNRFGDPYTYRPSFDCSVEETYMASYLYEREYVSGIVMEDIVSPSDLKGYGLTMSGVLHQFVSDYSKEPLKLVHLALKNAMAYGLPLDQLPQTLQQRAEKGLFTKISDIEKMLSAEGKQRLAGIRHNIEECRDEEDLNDFEDLDDYYQL